MLKSIRYFKFTVRLCSTFFWIHGGGWMGPTNKGLSDLLPKHFFEIGSLVYMFLSCHIRVSKWIHTLWLPECQGTPCSKQARNLKFKWLQLDSNPEQFSSETNTQTIWLNGWVFIYELRGSGFESSRNVFGSLDFPKFSDGALKPI